MGRGVSEIYRLRGNLLTASGAAVDQTEAAYREALDFARRQEEAIKAHEVLTLPPDYFRLRKPTERRIYEIARKHCGKQAE